MSHVDTLARLAPNIQEVSMDFLDEISGGGGTTTTTITGGKTTIQGGTVTNEGGKVVVVYHQ
jgi:hypothetical protein